MGEILLIVVVIGILLLSKIISPSFKVFVGIPLGVLGLTYIWFFSSLSLVWQLGFTIIVIHGAYYNYKKYRANLEKAADNPS